MDSVREQIEHALQRPKIHKTEIYGLSLIHISEPTRPY